VLVVDIAQLDNVARDAIGFAVFEVFNGRSKIGFSLAVFSRLDHRVRQVSREEYGNSDRISDVARTRIECEQRTALLKKGRELEDTRVARENASIEWKLFRNRREDAGVS